MGLSPAKTEYVLNQSTGSLYGDLAGTAENTINGRFNRQTSPLTRPFATRSLYQRSTGEFYDAHRAMESTVTTNKFLELDNEQSQSEAERLRQMDRYKDVISSIRKQATAEKDYDKKLDMDRWGVGMADYALGKPERESYPNPLHKDAKVPAWLDKTRDAFALSLIHSMTTDPSIKANIRAGKADELPAKQAKADMQEEWAVGEAKRLGYSLKDLSKLLIDSEIKRGMRPSPHKLGKLGIAWNKERD
jgi:hypothetical protein